MSPDRATRAAANYHALIEFLAANGADIARRHLARHQPTASGWCTCGTHRGPDPLEGLARTSQRLAQYRSTRQARIEAGETRASKAGAA